MGMDYKYAGNASYPRFNTEVKGIVELFGGKMITNRKPKEKCRMVEYYMEKPLKYWFPFNTPYILKKWAQHPYKPLSFKETYKLYKVLNSRRKEVEEISHQLMGELDILIKYKEGWEIC